MDEYCFKTKTLNETVSGIIKSGNTPQVSEEDHIFRVWTTLALFK